MGHKLLWFGLLLALSSIDFAAPRAASVVSDDVSSGLAQQARALAEHQAKFVAASTRGRIVFVAVERIRVKPKAGALRGGKLYRTLHYRYADGVTIYTTTDLTRNSVVSVAEVKNAPTPFSREEVDEAIRLARANVDLRRALGPRYDRVRIEVFPIYARAPNDAIFGHRATLLFFREGTRYIAGLQATVDLTAQTVTVSRRAAQTPHRRRMP